MKKKNIYPKKNLYRMQATLHMEKEVGEKLGGSKILLSAL